MAEHRQRRGRSEEERELEAEARDDALRGETEPADPLGQALPDVTEARRAEAGPEPRVPAGGGGSRRGRPVRDGDDEPEHHGHAHEHSTRRKGLFGRAADFLRASWAELRPRAVAGPPSGRPGHRRGRRVRVGRRRLSGLLDAIWNPIVQAIL